MKEFLRVFASLKLAIVLFIILAAASIVGTLIPQGRSVEEYASLYGGLAGPMMRLGLTGLYHSFWFLGFLFLFSLNILVCTLSRLPLKLRRARGVWVEGDARTILSLKVHDKLRAGVSLEKAEFNLLSLLAGRHYRVKKAVADGRIYFQARKRILGWFGSDIVHLGILVIVAGGIASGIGGFRTNLAFKEGEILDVPGSSFRLRLDKFETEYYPGGGVKDWKSTLTVLESSSAVTTKTVEVNHPLTHRGFSFFQASYGWDWEAPRLEIRAREAAEPAAEATVRLGLGERMPLSLTGLTHLSVARFVPDFVLAEGGEVGTRSREPNNPAALVEGWAGGKKVFSRWVFVRYPDFRGSRDPSEPDIVLEIKDFEAPPVSIIEAARDPGVGLIWAGCALITAGFFLAFYWPPREIRFLVESVQGKTEMTAGGTAPKSREAFAAEFESLMSDLRRLR